MKIRWKKLCKKLARTSAPLHNWTRRPQDLFNGTIFLHFQLCEKFTAEKDNLREKRHETRSKMSSKGSTRITKWKSRESIHAFNRLFRKKMRRSRHFKRKMRRCGREISNWMPSSDSSAKIIALNDISWATFGSRVELCNAGWMALESSTWRSETGRKMLSCEFFFLLFCYKKLLCWIK